MTFVLACTDLNAQQRDCGTMDILQQNLQEDPTRQETMDQIETFTQKAENSPFKVNGVISIPVVVHVIYNNNTENISDAQIMSQIDVLNDDFRRNNSDANNNWSQAADTEIEFCMATIDPNGNATNGITRTATNSASFGTNDQMKYNSSGGKNAWNTSEYLNMWVCDISGSILGYAQFPGSGAAATDGVVMDYQYFGTIGTATAPFDGGRTATHEVGHWLNLRHIWGDGACSVDDFVSDTPTSDAANYGCASSHSSCSSLDMVQNYMDYSDDACMNLFTSGQKSRMRALFDSGGFRESLLSSGACGSGGNTASCSDGIQNQGETGVDCGGPCAACACNGTNVTVSITFDNYPEETSWAITNASGATVASGGTYASQADGSTLNLDVCLPNGCYDFTISDVYGDGICCSYGNGSYSVSDNGSTLVSGATFTSSETNNFCVGAAAPTCNDGIQNQGEAGVDCGGPCTACASCNDGIQNQGESGVDCGGPCTACPTCNDGIQNQGESGVDCGGPCSACASCNDGIQNQGESGVDCGGPCTPCNSGCNGTEVTVSITFDNYPEETSWSLVNAAGATVASGGTYGSQADGSTWSDTFCLPDDCYDFVINDVYGDGICCSYGNGSYSVTGGGSTLASGGTFTSSETTNFCLGNGGGNNGGGGCTSVNIDSEGFEGGWGIWNDGGSDASRSSNYASSAIGTYCIRLRDNTSTSVMTTDNLNLDGFEEVTVDFTYIARSMESGEDFWLQASVDGGATYSTLKTYTVGTNFANDVREYDTVVVTGTFTSTTRFRFRCDASANADLVYIDEVTLTGCTNGSRDGEQEPANQEVTETQEVVSSSLEQSLAGSLSNLNLYPNPTSGELNIEFASSDNGTAQIYVTDISGKVVLQDVIKVQEGAQMYQLNMSDLPSEMYLVHIVCKDKVNTEKIILVR